MNPTDTLKEAHQSVVAEEKRLLAELAKLQAVRKALEAGMKAKAGDTPTKAKASPGGLKTAILGVLGDRPMSNSDIRAALERKNYGFSLSPLHVSKTLAKLLAARKVKRQGVRGTATYTRAGR